MKKALLSLLCVSLPAILWAVTLSTVYNPFTGKLDYINTSTSGGFSIYPATATASFPFGFTASTASFNGSGDGQIALTIFGSTYTVTSSSNIGAVGHFAMFSSTWGTLMDGGTGGGGGTPSGSSGQIQFNNGGSFGGAAGTFMSASSTTVSTLTISGNGMFTMVGPTQTNFFKQSMSNSLITWEFFQSGVYDLSITFGGASAATTFPGSIINTGVSSVIQTQAALISAAPSASPGLTAGGILDLWSASGNANYISFNEQGIANNGYFGFAAGNGDFVWGTGSETFGSGITRMRLSPTGGLTVSSSMTVTGAVSLSSSTWSGFTFAQLGAAAANGTFVYCSDCTVTTPATCLGGLSASCICANTGNGALAKRLNGAWYCN